MNRIEEMEIYQMAGSLADEIWEICAGWGPFPKYSMGRQMCRAADSIPANIAEGFGRFFYKENIRFFYFARGSLEETRNWLARAHKRELLKQEEFDAIMEKVERLGKRLNGLINSTKIFSKSAQKRPI